MSAFWRLVCYFLNHRWTYEHRSESSRLRARGGLYRMSEMRPVCGRCGTRRDRGDGNDS